METALLGLVGNNQLDRQFSGENFVNKMKLKFNNAISHRKKVFFFCVVFICRIFNQLFFYIISHHLACSSCSSATSETFNFKIGEEELKEKKESPFTVTISSKISISPSKISILSNISISSTIYISSKVSVPSQIPFTFTIALTQSFNTSKKK